MAYIIRKCIEDEIEYLPDIVDTPLWDIINPDCSTKFKKLDWQIAGLYRAICKRENYFQQYSPTAFGNPEYSKYCGVVSGFLQAMEAEESEKDDTIVIKQNKKTLLVVEKPKRPKSYYDDLKDNRETLSALGF